MSKYSLAFKQSVIAAYESGTEGARAVAAQFDVDHSTVRKWAAAHAAHGVSGLVKKFSSYDASFKLSVLQRMWDDGLSYRQAAAIFNIRNKSCLVDWEKRYERGGLEALAFRRRGRPRSMPKPPATDEPQALASDDTKSREELLSELAYLRMENAFLKKLEALTQEQQPLKKRKPFRR
jgi:transposase